MGIQKIDELRAFDFMASQDIPVLLEKYPESCDLELREDWVKMANYLEYRERGTEHVWALMSACRRAAMMAGGDRAFNEHARHRMNGMSEVNQRLLIEKATRAGVSTQGRYYVGGLGRHTDQSAWVSTSEDILDVAKRKNLNVSGVVNHQARPAEGPPQRVRMAPDLVAEKIQSTLKAEPATAEKVRKNPKYLQSVRERVIAKHSRQPRP